MKALSLVATMMLACSQPSPEESNMQPMPRKTRAPTPEPERSTTTFPTELPSDLPLVIDRASLDRGVGQDVIVRGTYVETVMSARPDALPTGHVAVQLADGLEVLVLVPWHADALRPKDQVARLAGKPVAVAGHLAGQIPEQHKGAAQRLMPCLTTVVALRPE